uniref:G-protein coupled receptors family 1 profile domain-containing protein n=1 Tax=Musca domestica TaxID=7370 RepID=A0A1I8NJV4_MUSDO
MGMESSNSILSEMVHEIETSASVAVSSWTLVAISCERYYAICHPLRSRRWQTRSHAYKIIACIWFGSMLCMTPIAIFSQLMPTSRQGYRKCRENWPGYALPYERPYNIFLDLVLLVLPLVILSVAYTLITRTLYVGMRIEKAMIFGGGSGVGGGPGIAGNCNGKLNSEEFYSTFHAKCGSSCCCMTTGGNINKAAYISTTTTPTSSMTTLASTSSAVSRLRFQFSLRRYGQKTVTNVTMKTNGGGGGGCAVGSSNNTTAAGNIGVGVGVGGSIMRSHFSLNKETHHLDETIQETDMFQQKPSSTKHYPQQYSSNQHQRLFQQQQQQNHCHNYHQHQMLLHHESDQDHHHQQQQHVSTKFCCEQQQMAKCNEYQSRKMNINEKSI